MTTAERFAAVVRGLVPAGGRAPTGRELDVARLAIVEGRTSAQIACQLEISKFTVKAHRRAFAIKLARRFPEVRVEILHRLLPAA